MTKPTTLDEAINRAAADLPYSWSIRIDVEAGAATVTLFDSFDEFACEFDDGDRTLAEQVSEAVTYAKEHA